MAPTPEELWGARSADAKAFADLLASNEKKSRRPRIESESATAKTAASKSSIPNADLTQFENDTGDKWYETPIAKGIIDALSVGSYTTAAIGNSVAIAARDKENGAGALWDQTINHNPIVMGIKAGFGDDDSRRTWSDVVKTTQENYGIDAETDEAKKWQGGLGMAGDIALDPLWFVGTGGISAGVKGAAAGVKNAGIAAKEVAKGGDALLRETSRVKGAIQGAKDGKAAYKADKAEQRTQNFNRSQLNAGIRAGVSPDVLESTVVRGFDSLPESVRNGSRKATKAEFRSAMAADDAMEGIAKAFPVAEEVAPIADETAPWANSIVNNSGADLSMTRTEELVRDWKAAEAELLNDSSPAALNKFRKTKADLNTVAKANGIDLHKEVKLAESAPEHGLMGPAVTPAGSARTGAPAAQKTASELPAAHHFVDSPGNINVLDHMQNTPNDRFVTGTADLTTQVPFYSAARNNKVIDALNSHPDVARRVLEDAKINMNDVAAFLKGKRLMSGGKNNKLGQFTRLNPKTGKPFGPKSQGSYPTSRRDLFDEFVKKVYPTMNKNFIAKGDEAGANAFAYDWLVKNVEPTELADLLKTSKAVMSPEIAERFWKEGASKPNMVDFRKEMFAGESVQPSLGQVQEMINSVGKTLPTKESGSFNKIISAYEKGTMPLINRGKLEAFAKDFFKLDEAADPKTIATALREFIAENSADIQKIGLEYAPTATNGRLALLVNGQTSDSIRLIESLPVGAMERYARPLRPQEAQSVITEMARATEAQIINGIAPEMVAKAADDIFRNHVLKYSTPIKDAKGETFRTRSGWSTSTQKLNDGGAKKEFLWTTHSIIDQVGLIRTATRKIMDQSDELARLRQLRQNMKAKTGVGSAQYKSAEKAYRQAFRLLHDDIAMRIWAGVDVSMKEGGLFGYLTNVMPKGEIAVRLSGYDVLNAMGPELRMKHLWAEKGDIANLQVTQTANLMETLIRSMAGAGMDGIISDVKVMENAKEILRGNFAKIMDKAGLNRVIERNLDSADHIFNANVIDDAVGAGKFNKNSVKTPHMQALTAREKMYSDLINNMLYTKGADNLTPVQRGIETMLRNTSLDNAQLSNKIITISDDHLAALRTALENDSFGKVFDIVTAVVRPDKFDTAASEVLEESIKNINGSMFSPIELAGASAQSKLASLFHAGPVGMQVNKPNLISYGDVPFGTKIRVPQTKINKANSNVAKATQNPAIAPEQIIETALKNDDEVFIDMVRQQDASDIAQRWVIGGKLFDSRYGMTKSYDQVTMGMHGTTQIETAFHAAVNEYARKFTVEQANIAFKSLQSLPIGELEKILAKGVEVDPQTYEMARLVSNIFDESKSNIFVRNGIGPETMNRVMDNMTNVPATWRFNPELEPHEMSQAWKEWTDINNPYKALSAIHTAMMKATTDISAGARFSSNFGVTQIPAGEMGKWARLGNVDLAKKKGEFMNLIDTELYYPKELIAEIPAINRFITGSRSFKNEQWQQWVTSFDEFTSALKITQTVMKPGHHVMSITGDYFRNALAGVTGNGAYKDSWRVIRAMNEGDKGLSEMDKFVNLKTAMSNDAIAGSADGLKLQLAGNKDFTISYRDLYTQFANRGIFLPAHNGGVAEDFLAIPGQHFDDLKGSPIANAVTKASRATNKIVSGTINNKFIKINGFTAQRDNLMRGALAIDILKKGRFKSVEEAIDAAEMQVRKWAPTAKDLTHVESKYVRRVFLYYTWLRGMIPRVAESLIAKPSLAVAPSKAMYNMAIANGLDPASFGDPFDPNEMFPNYFKEGVLGPQWEDPESGHLWGMNPTSPIMDVLNSVGSGVSLGGFIPGGDSVSNYDRIYKTLAGMTNPLIRSPFELGSGVNAGTGAPIKDKAQYLLDMPGPVRLASKITGKTFNPALGGVVNRTEPKFADGLEGDDFWNNAKIEGLNWFTGMQFRDYTSDAARKTAEFEEKNIDKQANTIAQRRGE